jgi:3-oxoacyl-[acyl-carrier protein] reductase
MRKGFILGATGFIGRELSLYFSSKGWSLILGGRDEKKLTNLSETIKNEYKIETEIFCHDLLELNEESIKKQLSANTSEIEFFINTSGTQAPIQHFIETSFKEWEDNIRTNLIAPTLLTQHFAQIFAQNKKGSIIIFSGGGGTGPRPSFSAYAVAKTGLIRFVETISQELQNFGVRINALSPGIMPSKMLTEIIENEENVSIAEIRKARETLGKTENGLINVISLCDFLVSDSSMGITGKLISAQWDNWKSWPSHIKALSNSDLYTLRRITDRDRNWEWEKP